MLRTSFRLAVPLIVLLLSITASAAAAQQADSDKNPQPVIVQNPNPSVPLAALLRFEPKEKGQVLVEVTDGNLTRQLRFDSSCDPQKGLPIVGLKPSTRYQFRVTLLASGGRRLPLTSSPVFYETPFQRPLVNFRHRS